MDRVQIQHSIRSLSAAVAQLPATEEHDQTRHSLNERIAEHKRAIVALKPFGAQLDGCRAALLRAEARKAKAIQARNDADLAIATAASEIDRLSADLASLEAQVALPEGSDATSAADCVDKLTASLRTVVDEMAASCHVRPDLVSETKAQMTNLLTGIKAIAAAAQASAATPLVPPAPVPAVGADAASSTAAPAHVTAAAAVQAQPANAAVHEPGVGDADWRSSRRLGAKTSRATAPYPVATAAPHGREAINLA